MNHVETFPPKRRMTPLSTRFPILLRQLLNVASRAYAEGTGEDGITLVTLLWATSSLRVTRNAGRYLPGATSSLSEERSAISLVEQLFPDFG